MKKYWQLGTAAQIFRYTLIPLTPSLPIVVPAMAREPLRMAVNDYRTGW